VNQTLQNLARFMSRRSQCVALALALLGSWCMIYAPANALVAPATLLAAVGLVVFLPMISSTVLARRSFAERTLIVGTSPLALKLLEEIAARPDCLYSVVGIADDGAGDAGFPFDNLVWGPLEELGAIVDALRPDRIVVALTDRRGRLPMRDLLAARIRGVQVEDGVELYERLTGKVAIEALTPSGLIASPHFRKTYADLAFGHALSLMVSALALIVLLPLFALIALAIKMDSPGPVLFVHDRVGAGGRRFKLVKFRTMRPREGPTSEWVRDNGHRITRVGGWLRKYRLDELPQLINVIRGDLNLVGPRPHPVSNFELFMEKIPYYSLRSVVRPGLTGWAQVRQGYANNLEEETEKMRYDLHYIKHMSLSLDLRILFRTVRIVFSGLETMAPRAAVPPTVQPALTGRLQFAHSPARTSVRYEARKPHVAAGPRSTALAEQPGPEPPCDGQAA
jgi:exopolysaccharide biosynthesis polyprenyl glycosylphosphotransferase